MSRIRVPRTGPGRLRTRPTVVLADRAYSSRAIRSHLRRRGIRAVIPQPSEQAGHRLRRDRFGGRPPGFDSEAYKQRNTGERCINRLKQWRGLATRTDKLAIAYQAGAPDMPEQEQGDHHALADARYNRLRHEHLLVLAAGPQTAA